MQHYDETASRRALVNLERRAQRVMAWVLSTAEDAVTNHHERPLEGYFDARRENQTPKRLNLVQYQEDATSCDWHRCERDFSVCTSVCTNC